MKREFLTCCTSSTGRRSVWSDHNLERARTRQPLRKIEPLKDPDVFKRFRVDTELNTISWETGADLAPEYLYEKTAQPGVAADAPLPRR